MTQFTPGHPALQLPVSPCPATRPMHAAPSEAVEVKPSISSSWGLSSNPSTDTISLDQGWPLSCPCNAMGLQHALHTSLCPHQAPEGCRGGQCLPGGSWEERGQVGPAAGAPDPPQKGSSLGREDPLKWQPTPACLSGKFRRQRSLAGYTLYRLQAHEELDTTEHSRTHTHCLRREVQTSGHGIH